MKTIFLNILFFILITFNSPYGFSAFDHRRITVRGTCLRSVTPDRGSVTLTAKTKDRDAGVVIGRATDLYNKLLERAKSLNLKGAEFETSQYSVHEEFDWSNNKKTSSGFSARISLTVSTSEIKRLGELIKIGADLKLEEGGNLFTFVSDVKMREEKESCLEEATQNAKKKAEHIARGAGVKLGKPYLLNEEGTTLPPPPQIYGGFKERAMMSEASSAPAQIETKDLKISVQIEASYLIE